MSGLWDCQEKEVRGFWNLELMLEDLGLRVGLKVESRGSKA